MGVQLPVSRQHATVVAFVGVVLIGGINLVMVRLSNQDLPPFFGAGLRFGLAATVLLLVIVAWKVPLPTGRALVGSLVYGLLAFGVFVALGYWALQDLSAGVAGVILAAVPLITPLLARIHGLEPLRWRGLAGGALTMVGIAVLLGAPMGEGPRVLSVVAMVAATICLAEAGIVAKKFPPCHPVATNGLGMAVGAGLLLVVSVLVGERWTVPTEPRTWLILAHLALLGSAGVFGLYLFVLGRWPASRASYQFVLMPFVAALVGAWLLGEPIGLGLVVGGAIVLLGVFVGALSSPRPPVPALEAQEPHSPRCSL